MLDRAVRPLIDIPLNAMARAVLPLGISPNAITLFGAALGIAAAFAIASGRFGLGCALIAGNRILDGLDGALARLRQAGTDLGGYLDSLCDYLFYAATPLAFAVQDPARNALPAAALLASFLLTAASFLAFAAIASKRAGAAAATGGKAFVYSRGLIEGTETIAFFVAMSLWPQAFAPLAWLCAGLCVVTALLRSAQAARAFRA